MCQYPRCKSGIGWTISSSVSWLWKSAGLVGAVEAALEVDGLLDDDGESAMVVVWRVTCVFVYAVLECTERDQ